MSVTSGIVLVDKPQGLTSHDVVARVRRAFGTRRVGHAGTLDPMATGLLVVGVEKATRLLTFLVGADKTYTATVRLGQETTTEDADGEVTATTPTGHLKTGDIAAALAGFRGDIMQVPSAVSAIKVEGQRAYARVRRGEQVELAARPVHISRLDLVEQRAAHTLLDLDIIVDCSSGTYIRALARDIGQALGVGAHLTALRRTRVGGFSVDNATPVDDLTAGPTGAPRATRTPPECVIPLADVAPTLFPVRTLTDTERADLAYGRRIDGASGGTKDAPVAGMHNGELIALLADDAQRSRPIIVF